ncbi:hypothetical protein B0H10DRAFT_172150 [Mycena sp. CBHHK59/15]|nr:hypothetical protein B0H10DRAFT_172150 [Mycena sp. CBHHK59/15]
MSIACRALCPVPPRTRPSPFFHLSHRSHPRNKPEATVDVSNFVVISSLFLVISSRFDHSIYNLEREACAVLDAAAVGVRALVRYVLQELVDEVAVCAFEELSKQGQWI